MNDELGQPFADTLVALDADQRRHRTAWTLLTCCTLIALWSLWLTQTEVQIYVASRSARVERQDISPLVAEASGRLVRTRLELGRVVDTGCVLAELDPAVEKGEFDEAMQRRQSFAPRIDALRSELERETTRLDREKVSAMESVLAMRSRLEEVTTAARFAKLEDERMQLLGSGAPELTRLRLSAVAEEQRMALSGAEAELRRLRADQVVRISAAQARVERLRQELAELEGEERAAAAVVDAAQGRLARRRVVAPHDGVIVATAGLHVGSVVREGDNLGTLMAPGGLRIVATFSSHDAVGKVRAGQIASMRLTGFPWTRFGTVHARVAHVAAEPTENATRVELALNEPEHSTIQLQHGLEGTVEIAVDQASPLALLLEDLGEAALPAQASP